MPGSPHPSYRTPSIDRQGRLATPIPCAGCQYNLRGLPPDATCPECGHAVEASARLWQFPAIISAKQRAHLARAASGIAVLLLWPLMAWTMFVAAATPNFSQGQVAVGGLYVYTIGAVWLTTTSLHGSKLTLPVVAAWLARIAIVFAFVAFVAFVTLTILQGALSIGLWFWFIRVNWITVLIFMITIPVQLQTLAVYLGRKFFGYFFLFLSGTTLSMGLLDFFTGQWMLVRFLGLNRGLFAIPAGGHRYSIVFPDVFFILPVLWVAMIPLLFFLIMRLVRSARHPQRLRNRS